MIQEVNDGSQIEGSTPAQIARAGARYVSGQFQALPIVLVLIGILFLFNRVNK